MLPPLNPLTADAQHVSAARGKQRSTFQVIGPFRRAVLRHPSHRGN